MLAKERQDSILKQLTQTGGIIKISDIVSAFSVSNETARRDLDALQNQNLVKRVYGGAMLTDHYGFSGNPGGGSTEPALESSSGSATGDVERAAIGQAAAELVNEGETILLGAGSTMLEVAHALARRLRNLTVITSSLAVVNTLLSTRFTVHLLGGRLDLDELNMSGYQTLRALQSIYVDKTFLGAGGVSFQFGISDYGQDDAMIREEMVNHCSMPILVAQSKKFGHNAFSLGIPLERMRVIISDKNLSGEYISGIRDMGIQLILAEP